MYDEPAPRAQMAASGAGFTPAERAGGLGGAPLAPPSSMRIKSAFASMPSLRQSAVVLSAVLAAGGCLKGRASEGDHRRPVRARVVPVEVRRVQRVVESVGSLFPYEEVTVSSEVEGKV